jgi:DHA1 family bicyclomycin/chloramphenicol resistance-like MFS transporter
MLPSAGGSDKHGHDRMPSFPEFVLLIALVMSLGSLSIDNLLPAFGPSQADFAIANPNDLQLLITTYMVPFGIMQLVYGPVSDVIGRRPALMIGLAVYVVGGVIATLASSFSMLLEQAWPRPASSRSRSSGTGLRVARWPVSCPSPS